MRIFHGFDALPSFRRPAAAVGSFDGVHGGHKLLLDRIVAEARVAGGESIVLTFEPHPRITLGCTEGLRLLTSTEEKAWLLEREGVDNLIIIPFDRAFSRLTPDRFVREYLIGRVGVETLVVGYNHRFGHGKEGDYAYLDRLHEAFGFRVMRIPEYDADDEKVSSTVLRRLIGQGKMDRAARMMPHPYLVIGEVVNGEVRLAEPLKLLPPPGDYPVQANNRPAWLRIGVSGSLSILSEPRNEEEYAQKLIGSQSVGREANGAAPTDDSQRHGAEPSSISIGERPEAEMFRRPEEPLPDGKIVITFRA